MGETERLTLREAADLIGIPLDSLRKRVYRGTIPPQKVNGQYFVLASDAKRLSPTDRTAGETVSGHGVRQGETPADSGSTRELIDHLRSEVEFLRSQNETLLGKMANERERFDVIHRESLQRIEALTDGVKVPEPEPVTDTHTASPDATSEAAAVPSTPDTLRQSWRFWKRRKP